MALYSMFDMLKQISDILVDGYDVADISILEPDEDDELPEHICFSVYDSYDESGIEYDGIDAIDDLSSDESLTIDDDSPCMAFSLNELSLIKDALSCSINTNNRQLKNPSSKLSRDDILKIKSSSAHMRNLFVQIEQILKECK